VPRSSSVARGACVVGASAAVVVAFLGAAGCDDDCCTIDSMPIPVTRAPLGDGAGFGAMLGLAQPPGGGASFPMVIDTGSPVTILAGTAAAGTLEPTTRGFDLLDATAAKPIPVRARFRGLELFTLPLGPVGDAATAPGGVLGGDLLHAFSVEMRFAAPCGDVALAGVPTADGGASDADAGAADAGDGTSDAGVTMGAAATPGTCSSVTFWSHQDASLAFLEDAGYAVLRFAPFGGGETTANAPPGFLGLQGPVTLPATRVVFRACAVPPTFTPTGPREQCCTRGAELGLPRGIDLSLLFSSGVGPLVLSQAAWTRVATKLTTAPAMTSAPLYVATWPTPIAASWATIPRFALVDGFEPPSTGDEGPCVDLGRARRIEWIATQQQAHPDLAACVEACDTDPTNTSDALNSAAYIELGGAIPVAVVADEEPYLQALRFDIRPEGPDIDGVVGAGALGVSRVEVDYLSNPNRAIFSCEAGATRDTCFASARCPHLPDHSSQHLCFGLPLHGLPATCAPSGC
jgi:hypothetical protein